MKIGDPILLTTQSAADRLADPSFGSYMLNGLKEITLPEPPSYRPQTIGWGILAGVVLLSLTLWGIQQYRIWCRNRYRRTALKQLTELAKLSQQPSTQAEALRRLCELLKRTALAAYPREHVAQLHGSAWLSFLDNTYGGNEFVQGNGHLLSQLPYQPPDAITKLSSETITELIAVVRRWIVLHQR